MKARFASLLVGLAAPLLAGCHRPVDFQGSAALPVAAAPDWAQLARFVVTNNRSDTLSFVTADSPPAPLAEVPIGDNPVELEGPHHVAASPDGAFLVYNLSNYVPGTGSGPHGSHGLGNVPGSLVKLDAHTLQKLGEVAVDRSPGDVILSADGKYAYVTHYDMLKLTTVLSMPSGTEEMAYSTLAIVATDTMERLALLPVCVTAHGEGLSGDGRILYVTCAQTDQLAVVDVSDARHPTVVLRTAVGPNATRFGGQPSYSPYALSVSPKDGTVFVSDNASGDVRVFDPVTMKMDPARTKFIGGVAMFGTFSPDGGTLFVPHQGDNKVTAIDSGSLATRELALPLASCNNPHAIVPAPGGKRALLVCEGDHVTAGSVAGLDLTTLTVTGYLPVGVFPDGAAWLPPQ